MAAFDDKVVLVTGASSGIGKATALMLGERGAHVLVAARRIDACTETAEAIIAAGGKADVVAMDVADLASLPAIYADIRSRFGRLDGAFNNAGISSSLLSLSEAKPEETHNLLQVNLAGMIESLRLQVALMREQGKGAIVNNSSMAGMTGYAGLSVYSATKHAVVGLTKSVARENAAYPIRVNCVCPGPIKTEMVTKTVASIAPGTPRPLFPRMPMRRIGHVNEVAEPVCFLLSDAASFITGAILPVDGGEICALGEPDAHA